MKKLITLLSICCLPFLAFGQYKGVFVGGAAFTGLNLQNWAGSKTATATPFYQLNAGFSFQSKKGLLVDFIPIAFSYNSAKFSATTGVLVRYYFKNQ